MAGPGRRRRPTMAEVARAAGVSVMTVSYAYSRPDRVSAEALAKVREAARRLGYPGPHPGARSLRRGRAGSLGVVLGEHLAYAFDDPQATRFLAGVADVCAAHGLGLMLLPITGAAADVDRVAEAAVDGFVVWTTADDDPVVDAVAATGLPAVVHGGPHREGLPFVAIDEPAAARAVAAEAFAGARRPAIVGFPLERSRAAGIRRGPPPEDATFRVTRQRLRGMRDAWQDLGGDWTEVQVAVCATNSAAEAERRATELLAQPDAPDAVAAMSDELAFGVLRAAAHLGRRVPDDLTVTGWDDTAQAGPAGLTTIGQSLRDQGAHCARFALGETPVHPYEPEWTLVRRESTRRPRRNGR
jgi:DNA-binding LacI/PurR family transcriptional regulator